MAIYCIGDIQGCDNALHRLLDTIGFSPSRDTIYLLGDLVNRGPTSADVLRRCMRNEGAIQALLGNHDLHLLAAAHGARKPSKRDTLAHVMEAPDHPALLDWLRQQPLARTHTLAGETLLMVHAGVLHSWTLEDVVALSGEVHAVLRGPQLHDFLHQMYGNTPDRWDAALQGTERLRAIVNENKYRYSLAAGILALCTLGVMAALYFQQRKYGAMLRVRGREIAPGGRFLSPRDTAERRAVVVALARPTQLVR